MTQLYLTFLACLMLSTLSAQDFAPVGAEWHYTRTHAFTSDVDFTRFTVVKDTVFLGDTCRQIVKHNRIVCMERPHMEFIYDRNDSVFFFNPDLGEFSLLYDFTAEAGDSWEIRIQDDPSLPTDYDTVTITVDTTGVQVVNGVPLKVLNVTYHRGDEHLPQTYSGTIIERIGDLFFLFNWPPTSQVICDGDWSGGLRCYEDAVVGNYNTTVAPTCDFQSVGIDEVEASQVSIFPNPAVDWLTISSESGKPMTLELIDLTGKLVHSCPFQFETRMDLSSTPQGIYLLKVLSEGQLVQTKRVIRE